MTNLQDAEIFNSPYHEDTITQNLVLFLNRNHQAENRCQILSRADESKNGADFVWHIFNSEMTQYIPVAVQAKRLTPSGKYEAFKKQQVKDILKYAHKIQGPAIYLTYNLPQIWFDHAGNGRSLFCLKFPADDLEFSRDLGLIYFYADQVKNINDSKLKPIDFVHDCYPIWIMFCSCNAGKPIDTQLGNTIQILSNKLKVSDEKNNIVVDPNFQPRKIPDILHSWMSGGDINKETLRKFLGLNGDDNAEGYKPSFLLGTKLQ